MCRLLVGVWISYEIILVFEVTNHNLSLLWLFKCRINHLVFKHRLVWVKINIYSLTIIYSITHHLCQGDDVFTCVSLLVGWQDYAKATELISTTLSRSMDLSPEWHPMTFGVDPDKGEDPGKFSHFFDMFDYSSGCMDLADKNSVYLGCQTI